MVSSIRILALLAVLGGGTTVPAAAHPIDADWTEVARIDDGDCTLVVTGNGRFYRIATTGLGSGEAARYFLGNGSMRPIDWAVRADSSGDFARYYLPYRENHGDSTVSLSLTSASCSLSVSFAFERAGIVMH